MNYKCDSCDNEKLFYNEISVVAKKVFNQKTGKEYIRDKANQIDEFRQPIYCYKCGQMVAEDSSVFE